MAETGNCGNSIYCQLVAAVRTLTNGSWPAGRHSLAWSGTTDDGHMAAGGVYFYRLEAEGSQGQRRMVLLR